MNAYDRANLKFLMTASEQVLAEWYAQASEDDLAYAAELLDQHQTELDAEAIEQNSENFGVRFVPSTVHYLQ